MGGLIILKFMYLSQISFFNFRSMCQTGCLTFILGYLLGHSISIEAENPILWRLMIYFLLIFMLDLITVRWRKGIVSLFECY
jgi:membrane protein DedA with SNARE-associated domain